MGIMVEWDNDEKTVIRFIYNDLWTWDDFYIAIKSANEMMDSVTLPIVSIIDRSNTNYIPPNSMRHVRNAIIESQSHNNSGISISIQSEDYGKQLTYMAVGLSGSAGNNIQFFYVNTLEEARQLAKDKVQEIHGVNNDD